MLAGYLPFDDDPANPEGDNINLLYKYIVSTPLTFPEYVTPHARDLLKRILVPDPRKRADLFEVARHSWLSEYAHVVGFITSSTTTSNDIASTTVPSGTINLCVTEKEHTHSFTEDAYEPPHLARSASVREPSKMNPPVAALGGLTQKQGQIDQPEKQKSSRDTKRRTVQVEYVAPQSSTVRGDGGAAASAAAAAAAAQAKTRARSESQGPVEVSGTDGYHSQRQRTTTAPMSLQPPTRPARDQQRAASENVAAPGAVPVASSGRPSTGGSMSASSRLPSRGNSYGQPAVAVAKDQAQGRFSQPRGKQYTVTSPTGLAEGGMYPQSASHRESAQYTQEYEQAQRAQRDSYQGRGHKRSSTFSELGGKLFGRRTSIFESKTSGDTQKAEKKSHPPISMTRPIPNDVEPRRSTDSRRTSFSFARRDKNGTKEQDNTGNRASRRFSFIPAALANFGSNRNSQQYPPGSSDSLDQRQQPRSRADSRARTGFGRSDSRSPSRSTTASQQQYDRPRDSPPQRHNQTHAPTVPSKAQRYASQPQPLSHDSHLSSDNTHFASQPNSNGEYYRNVSQPAPSRQDPYGEENYRSQYPAGFNSYEDEYAPARREKNVLQKPHRKFPEGYEKEGHGTSGRAQRVMDFFRNRGKARAGE
jgi:protein-serine/threonine kinase